MKCDFCEAVATTIVYEPDGEATKEHASCDPCAVTKYDQGWLHATELMPSQATGHKLLIDADGRVLRS